MKTYGDYAAIVAASQNQTHDEWHTAVTDLSTGQLWMVPARKPDFIPATVLAVSDAHVYVVEGRYTTQQSEVVRYDLSQLDLLEDP